MDKTAGVIKFIIGIMFCLSSATLMIIKNDIPLPAVVSLSAVGIALIATSKYRLFK